jgi:hypothetical protein
MDKNPLIILVTRMHGDDEFGNHLVWGFPPSAVTAFIGNSYVEFAELKHLKVPSDVNWAERLVNDEVWVIKGQRMQSSDTMRSALKGMPWSKVTRKFQVLVHRGGGKKAEDSDFQEEFSDLRTLISGAKSYSLTNSIDLEHPVVKFAQVVKNKQWSEFSEALKGLRYFFLNPGMRIRILKHRIDNLFLPIDTDLQGWRDSGFSPSYCLEIIKAYPRGKADTLLAFAREALYGIPVSKPPQDYVQKVVEEVKRDMDQTQRQKVTTQWEIVKNLLPPTEENKGNSTYQRAFQIISKIHDQGEFESAKAEITGDRNPLRDWLTKLDDALDKLSHDVSAE